MSVAIFTTYSDGNIELVALTHPNHEAYAKRHGYHRAALEIEYDAPGSALEVFGAIKYLLSEYDYVLIHGGDVIFMDLTRKVESLNRGEAMTLAREALGWWPINNDVMLFKRCAESRALVDRLIVDEPIWKSYEWGWQTHLWNLIREDSDLRESIRLAHPKEMNATHQGGESRWQLGDFIVHLMDMPMVERIRLAKSYLALAGDGTYKQ